MHFKLAEIDQAKYRLLFSSSIPYFPRLCVNGIIIFIIVHTPCVMSRHIVRVANMMYVIGRPITLIILVMYTVWRCIVYGMWKIKHLLDSAICPVWRFIQSRQEYPTRLRLVGYFLSRLNKSLYWTSPHPINAYYC